MYLLPCLFLPASGASILVRVRRDEPTLFSMGNGRAAHDLQQKKMDSQHASPRSGLYELGELRQVLDNVFSNLP